MIHNAGGYRMQDALIYIGCVKMILYNEVILTVDSPWVLEVYDDPKRGGI